MLAAFPFTYLSKHFTPTNTKTTTLTILFFLPLHTYHSLSYTPIHLHSASHSTLNRPKADFPTSLNSLHPSTTPSQPDPTLKPPFSHIRIKKLTPPSYPPTRSPINLAPCTFNLSHATSLSRLLKLPLTVASSLAQLNCFLRW